MFKIHHREIDNVEPFLLLPITEGETYSRGEALKLAEGKATICGAAELPEYICVGPCDALYVPAFPVHKTTVFEAEYTAKPAVGAKVTLHTDGLQVTATAGGAFEVLGVDETAQTATGKFVEMATA